MNHKKIKFIRAVRLLAPRDTLILQFAELVAETDLPEMPGAAALEFVAAIERMKSGSVCHRPAGLAAMLAFANAGKPKEEHSQHLRLKKPVRQTARACRQEQQQQRQLEDAQPNANTQLTAGVRSFSC